MNISKRQQKSSSHINSQPGELELRVDYFRIKALSDVALVVFLIRNQLSFHHFWAARPGIGIYPNLQL